MILVLRMLQVTVEQLFYVSLLKDAIKIHFSV